MAAVSEERIFTIENSSADRKLLRFRDMRELGMFTDCEVLCANGEQLKCHRMILAAGSVFFEAAFSHNMIEGLTGKIKLNKLNSSAVYDIVDYFYTGILNVPKSMIMEYFEAAHYLQLEELFDIFDNLIADNIEIQVENCLDALQYCDKYNLRKTRLKTWKPMLLPKVSKLKDFQNLTIDTMNTILNHGVTDNECVEPLLQFAINWMVYGDNRSQHIDSFFQILRNPFSTVMTAIDLYKVETIRHFLLHHASTVQSDKDKFIRASYGVLTIAHFSFEGTRIFVYGEFGTFTISLFGCWRLDLTSEKSIRLLDHKTICYSAICLTNRGVLAIGEKLQIEDGCQQVTRICELLNLSTLTWDSFPDAPMPIVHAAAVSLDDHAFVINEKSDTMLILELTTRKWKPSSLMLNEVRNPVAGVIDLNIFVLSNSYANERSVSFQ